MESVVELQLQYEFLDIWLAKARGPELSALEGPRHKAAVSVVVLEERPELDELPPPGRGLLRFRASRASLVCSSDGPTVVVLLREAEALARHSRLGAIEGDAAFLASLPPACLGEVLLATSLLTRVRASVGGVLSCSSGAQVWVNEPGREWSIKYQPRKRNFLVRIYGTPAQHQAVAEANARIKPSALKPERSAYTRFCLSQEQELELEDAVRLIENAQVLRERTKR